mmetsp:Transcript_27325/g.42504  ORF Transcript_27325/g.42504 Transcript_27325/m.42504 type:complete len:93 (-) Transcript_27325:65-343(-)|eukprot:CAMPEP_0201538490 /NCGR_PEP_ID=MMETSP0161_2-20130828/67772_1 /ASSEMBLY_ACC=CAM_ASM_000251 /TAXON_ID=180227 /ORGANISM="Neoparamoeba aestuarina, Strain SoJaBio B1-5/56/2" /LENGTH=92 /DNA_ID=CAMNT_0047945359 /DNA_START=187 /DNA_END=465 /DNA_ORIENTATION=+
MNENRAVAGGAVYLVDSSAEIENSQFNRNGAVQRGGVIYCSNSSLVIHDNIFYEDLAPEGACISCLNCTIDPSSTNNDKSKNFKDDGGCPPY